MSKEMNRVFESKEAEDKTQKDFVINTFKEMYLKYKDTFKDDGLSDIQLANKFEDNIMSGFFDFAILNGHKFGSVVQTSISNYLSIKHGCWLNTIDYAKKYEPKNLQLAVGFIVHKDDLDKVNKDIENDFAPVYIDLIPHGFFVDKDGDIFDPTLGVNEDFHYFYKVVPEELAPLFGKYKNEMCDIATYFAFDNKISNMKIDLEEDGLSVKTQPEIELNEKIEKSLYTVMNDLCLHFEIKDGYLKVTYNDYFSDGSIFKYNIICCIDKASEEKFKYQIGYAKLCERWYYSEERKYNME